MNPKDVCALCRSEQRQEDSHIIPAFVYRWLKKSSPTGFFRGAKEPNKRLQDGVKIPLLGPNCEDQFNIYETKFASEVFHEVHGNGRTDLSFDYGDWLGKFCVSISWRSLRYLIDHGGKDKLPHGHGQYVEEALEVWRGYLVGACPDIAPFRQHFFLLDAPTSGLPPDDLEDIGTFITRGVDFDTVHSPNPDECYVFSKLCDFLIVGTIRDPNPSQWIGSEVNMVGGRYSPRDFRVSGCFTAFLETAIQQIREARKNISQPQLAKIAEALHRRSEKAP